MLDQLVESKSHAAEDTKRSGFLLTTFILMVTILMSAWLYSLFAKDYAMGGDELSLETLVAPPVIEEAPEPEPEKQQQKDPNVDVRKEIIASMTETPPKVPDKVSNEKLTIPPRDPNKYTVKGDTNYSALNAPPPDYRGPVNVGGGGSDSGGTGGGGSDETGGAAPPPPPKPKPVPKQISGGVLNGKATSLPKPPYPPAARAVRAAGAVSVQVLIDESGSVVSASAVSGHPLLRAAAVQAARGARFSPTQLSGQPVKVSGVITYNFVP
ncbi:MAG TPA: TonB family protein [Pyrinomonadaceae bacterium]|nr:TonB family protein [Pyrinomonadaceae bacterium]